MTEKEANEAILNYKTFDCSREDYFSDIREAFDKYSWQWFHEGKVYKRVLALHLVKRLDDNFLIEDAIEFLRNEGLPGLTVKQYQEGGWYDAAKLVEELKAKGDPDITEVAYAHCDFLNKILFPPHRNRMYVHRSEDQKAYVNGLWARDDDEAYYRLKEIYQGADFHFAEYGWGTDFKIREIK